MSYAPVNGISVYYESYGAGFPLVLAYGLGGSTADWSSQIGPFSEKRRLILWDPRGHGRSQSPPEPDRYGLQISADDLLGLLDYLGIERAYVGGLSMGGGISARFAVKHPHRVAALLIIDSASATGLPMSQSMRTMRERTIELIETQGMGMAADYMIDSNPNLETQAHAGEDARNALRQKYLALDPVGYANTIRAMLEPDFSPEELPKIMAPTLVLAGELDPALESAQLTHSKISGSQLVVIPGAGHLSNLDQPELFNRAVLDFLARIDATIRV